MENPIRFKHLIHLTLIVLFLVLIYTLGRSIYELGYSRANLDNAHERFDRAIKAEATQYQGGGGGGQGGAGYGGGSGGCWYEFTCPISGMCSDSVKHCSDEVIKTTK